MPSGPVLRPSAQPQTPRRCRSLAVHRLCWVAGVSPLCFPSFFPCFVRRFAVAPGCAGFFPSFLCFYFHVKETKYPAQPSANHWFSYKAPSGCAGLGSTKRPPDRRPSPVHRPISGSRSARRRTGKRGRHLQKRGEGKAPADSETLPWLPSS